MTKPLWENKRGSNILKVPSVIPSVVYRLYYSNLEVYMDEDITKDNL